jgi:hypothetical protein
LQEIEQFLLAAKGVRFEASQREEIYGWVEGLLCQQEYARQGRRVRGLRRRYLGKMTGLSRAQLTRLVGRYLATGRVRIRASRRHRFPTRYTRADIELLAQVDEAHETLSGPATRRVLEREFRDYGKPEFERLAATGPRVAEWRCYLAGNKRGKIFTVLLVTSSHPHYKSCF